MNQTQIGEGCEINKAIIAENVVVGNQVKLGVELILSQDQSSSEIATGGENIEQKN